MTTPLRDEPPIDARLEAWLAIATRGLSDEATRRVRDEFIDHYLEAEEDLRASGVEADEVARRILSGFGDPEKTGRSLRRANLRPWEARIVRDLRRRQSFRAPLSVLSLVIWIGLIPAFVAVTWDHVNTPWWSDARFLVCVMVLLSGVFARFWLVERLADREHLRAALFVDTFSTWAYFSTLVLGTNLLLGQRSIANEVFYFVCLLVAIGILVHLWPKLGRRREG